MRLTKLIACFGLLTLLHCPLTFGQVASGVSDRTGTSLGIFSPLVTPGYGAYPVPVYYPACPNPIRTSSPFKPTTIDGIVKGYKGYSGGNIVTYSNSYREPKPAPEPVMIFNPFFEYSDK